MSADSFALPQPRISHGLTGDPSARARPWTIGGLSSLLATWHQAMELLLNGGGEGVRYIFNVINKLMRMEAFSPTFFPTKNM